MEGQQSTRPPAGAIFTWHRALWTVIMAAAAGGLYCLHQHRIMTEEQLMLLIFLLVPVAAFLLSGRGQDRTQIVDNRPVQGDRYDER